MKVPFQTGSAEKLTWSQARESVAKVNLEFLRIIDEISPDERHWLLKVRYPYGCPVMKRSVLMLPNKKCAVVPITDSSIDKEIREGLNYNLNSNPVSLVLKNSFEIFLPLSDRAIPLSGIIKPGTAFGAARMLSPGETEHPIFIWEMTSGARSVFMIPKITEAPKHQKLEKALGVNLPFPRTLMQHFDVFRLIASSQHIKHEPWSAEILYFSENWFKHLDDEKWSEFYNYFRRSGWGASEFWRNQPIWNLIFSLVVQNYESKPNAYIMDTVKYLLNMGIGSMPGLGPVSDTTVGPFDFIQEVYSNIYEIRHYPPIVIQPQLFDMKNKNANPVYYSLQFPNALEFKPSSRKRASIISDLHEIRSLMKRYESEMLSDKYNIDGTSLMSLFNKVRYDYFHSAVELHEGMRDSAEMANDIRLRTTLDGKVYNTFPSTCLFGKGCIRVAPKLGKNL